MISVGMEKKFEQIIHLLENSTIFTQKILHIEKKINLLFDR